ncbi:hypothetical protein EIN_059790 [Entamoeba invadens IP1]|uniref:hypothetical protein n=1 Tax=Entamoeba invadens IP1 TaxID=370355 RepID=UPI0002C3F868|nr:hypothetical protein EIN_059790 [Entamoeba invadens IP1]ELP93484.1 hypothetical protein EIN_059790 [Entamoeba invadens IP1]|eukprot:XP_004260255.1 hypothetical protein EIN_059790 [Entamoeba invadens IP1]
MAKLEAIFLPQIIVYIQNIDMVIQILFINKKWQRVITTMKRMPLFNPDHFMVASTIFSGAKEVYLDQEEATKCDIKGKFIRLFTQKGIIKLNIQKVLTELFINFKTSLCLSQTPHLRRIQITLDSNPGKGLKFEIPFEGHKVLVRINAIDLSHAYKLIEKLPSFCDVVLEVQTLRTQNLNDILKRENVKVLFHSFGSVNGSLIDLNRFIPCDIENYSIQYCEDYIISAIVCRALPSRITIDFHGITKNVSLDFSKSVTLKSICLQTPEKTNKKVDLSLPSTVTDIQCNDFSPIAIFEIHKLELIELNAVNFASVNLPTTLVNLTLLGNSMLKDYNFVGMHFLTFLSLSNCVMLSDIVIPECVSFCDISRCPNLAQIGGKFHEQLSISHCPKLKEIKIEPYAIALSHFQNVRFQVPSCVRQLKLEDIKKMSKKQSALTLDALNLVGSDFNNEIIKLIKLFMVRTFIFTCSQIALESVVSKETTKVVFKRCDLNCDLPEIPSVTINESQSECPVLNLRAFKVVKTVCLQKVTALCDFAHSEIETLQLKKCRLMGITLPPSLTYLKAENCRFSFAKDFLPSTVHTAFTNVIFKTHKDHVI